MPDPVQAATSGGLAWSFLAGLGGAAIPLGVMWVKLRLDQLSARCDAFAKTIDETAKLALDYWLLGLDRETGVADGPESDEGKEFAAKAERFEIQLRGAQTILQLDVLRLSREMPKVYRGDLQRELGDLISALTGGRFGDRDGFREPLKARAANTASARIIRIVRISRDEITKPHNLIRFLFGWL